MEIKIDVPDYNTITGFKHNWENDFKIRLGFDHDAIILTANKAGLISIANHLLNLAQAVYIWMQTILWKVVH